MKCEVCRDAIYRVCTLAKRDRWYRTARSVKSVRVALPQARMKCEVGHSSIQNLLQERLLPLTLQPSAFSLQPSSCPPFLCHFWNKNSTVGWHSWFCKALRIFQCQFDTKHLSYSVFFEIGVFWGEAGFGIYSRDSCL